MCRRFGWLNSRVLLYRQDELAKLEETLIEMDDEDITYKGGLTLKSRKEDDDREDIEEQYSRKTLINQIDEKLKEYREFSPPYHRRFECESKKVRKTDISAFIYRRINITNPNPCCAEKTKRAQFQFFQKLDD